MTNLLHRLFNWAKPGWMKIKGTAPMTEEELVRRLARVEPNDPVYAAVMELVWEQFAVECQALLRYDLGTQVARGRSGEADVSVTVSQVSGSAAAEYQRGRAASLYFLLDRIESERERAREEVRDKQKRETSNIQH